MSLHDQLYGSAARRALAALGAPSGHTDSDLSVRAMERLANTGDIEMEIGVRVRAIRRGEIPMGSIVTLHPDRRQEGVVQPRLRGRWLVSGIRNSDEGTRFLLRRVIRKLVTQTTEGGGVTFRVEGVELAPDDFAAAGHPQNTIWLSDQTLYEALWRVDPHINYITPEEA